MKIAVGAARHRVGGPRGELQPTGADDRRRGRRRRAVGCAHRAVLHRLLAANRADGRAASSGPSTQFLADQAIAQGVWVCGSLPGAPTAIDRPFNRLRARRSRGGAVPLRQDPPVHVRARGRALRRGRRARHRRRRGRPGQLVRLLRPALRRRVLGARARHRLLRGRCQLAVRRDASTGGRCCAPVRSRTRPTSWARTASGPADGLDYAGDSVVIGPFGEEPRDRGARHRERRPERSSTPTWTPSTSPRSARSTPSSRTAAPEDAHRGKSGDYRWRRRRCRAHRRPTTTMPDASAPGPSTDASATVRSGNTTRSNTYTAP